MNFNWIGFLEFAEKYVYLDDGRLLNPVEETVLRISISRAYYAAFCFSRNYLRDVLEDDIVKKAYEGDIRELQRRKLSIHKYVINQLSADQTTRKISIKLSRLKVKRVKADYHDYYEGDIQKEYNRSINDANTIISKIKGLIT